MKFNKAKFRNNYTKVMVRKFTITTGTTTSLVTVLPLAACYLFTIWYCYIKFKNNSPDLDNLANLPDLFKDFFSKESKIFEKVALRQKPITEARCFDLLDACYYALDFLYTNKDTFINMYPEKQNLYLELISNYKQLDSDIYDWLVTYNCDSKNMVWGLDLDQVSSADYDRFMDEIMKWTEEVYLKTKIVYNNIGEFLS